MYFFVRIARGLLLRMVNTIVVGLCPVHSSLMLMIAAVFVQECDATEAQHGCCISRGNKCIFMATSHR